MLNMKCRRYIGSNLRQHAPRGVAPAAVAGVARPSAQQALPSVGHPDLQLHGADVRDHRCRSRWTLL